MFINTKNIAAKALTLISAAALTLSSCVQLGEEQDGAYGYLTITGFDVNVQVEQLVPTKGANLPNISEPNESDIVYKVTDKNGKVYQSNDNSWVSPLRIPVGSYTLEAWSGSNDEFGAPYFYGKTENASINIGNNTGNVTLYVANSLVAVTLGKDLEGHFTANEDKCVKLSVSDNSYVEATLGEYVFVPSGKALYVKVKGSNTAGGESIEYSVGITADKIQKGYAHNVILSVNEDSLPSVNFGESNVVAWGNAIFITSSATARSTNVDMNKVKYYAREVGTSSWTYQAENNIISGLESDKTYEVMASVGALSSVPFTPSVNNIIASAKHTDTNGDASGGDLNGTDLKIDEASIPSNVKSNCTFTLNNSNGDTIHSFTSLQFVGADATDGWPYLPQGQYTLIATATVNGKEISSMTTIKVPAPEFGVTFKNAYTSYDKYKGTNNISQSTSEANTCDPDMLKGSGVSCTISSQLMGNQKYSKSFKVHKRDETPIGNIKTEFSSNDFTHDIDGLNWTSYEVASSFTFDGVTKTSGYKTHHITGLPYDLSKAPQKDKWTLSGGEAEWDNNYIHLDHATENSATLKLSVIGSINVSLKTSFSIYTPTRFGSPSLTISAGGNDISKTTGASGTAKTTNYNDVTCDGSLSSTNPTIKFNRTYFAGREGEVYIKALLITYR